MTRIELVVRSIDVQSTEAEYRSMAMTLCELKWLRRLLDFRVPMGKSISLYCENQSTLHVAANPVFYERIKHIEINCYFVRNAFQIGFLSPRYIRSDIQPVNIFTKTLHSSQFQFRHSSWTFLIFNLRGKIRHVVHILDCIFSDIPISLLISLGLFCTASRFLS